MAGRRDRPISRAHIGTVLTEPNINWAMMAKSMGCHGEGPITDPKSLSGAFKRAIQIVKRGEPALVDVVSQGR
jgi:thiamine pyrophosphate-dependent acetolactate synthase large subunit-like protein